MKIKHIIALVAISAAFLTGCATTSTQPTNTEAQAKAKAAKLASVAEMAAFSGTTLWLKDHPGDASYFRAASAALSVMLADTTGGVTPERLSAILKDLPIKQLQSDEGALIVGNAIILYDAFLAEHVNLDGNVYLRPIVTAIYSGITRALH